MVKRIAAMQAMSRGGAVLLAEATLIPYGSASRYLLPPSESYVSMTSTELVAIGDHASLLVATSGQGPHMLMVGGLGDDHSVYEPLVGQVQDRFTCISYDHRGSGRSSALPEDADIAAIADDGHRLLEQLGLSGIIGVGCSMGGTVVQEWALRYPDDFSKLVLMSTFARPRRLLRATMDHWERL